MSSLHAIQATVTPPSSESENRIRKVPISLACKQTLLRTSCHSREFDIGILSRAGCRAHFPRQRGNRGGCCSFSLWSCSLAQKIGITPSSALLSPYNMENRKDTFEKGPSTMLLACRYSSACCLETNPNRALNRIIIVFTITNNTFFAFYC